MVFRYSWITAKKELYLVKKRKILIISVILIPLLFASVLIMLFVIVFTTGNASNAVDAIPYVDPLIFILVLAAAIVPLITSTYSLVGEKIENTLEPLLATPATDMEILSGKYIAALLPSILSVLFAATVLAVASDIVMDGQLGYVLYPNWLFAADVFLAAPLSALLMTGLSVLFSARAKSVQSAQAYGRLMLFLFAIPIILNFLVVISLNNVTVVLAFASGIAVADVLVFYLSLATFNREEILTKWK